MLQMKRPPFPGRERRPFCVIRTAQGFLLADSSNDGGGRFTPLGVVQEAFFLSPSRYTTPAWTFCAASSFFHCKTRKTKGTRARISGISRMPMRMVAK